MAIFAIASLYKNNDLIGYRLLETSEKQIKDVAIGNIASIIMHGRAKIENMELQDNKLVGTNGSLDRLTKIVNGRVEGRASIVIINQIGDIGYTVANFNGNVLKLTTKDTNRLVVHQPPANGKVAYKNYKQFISSIRGEYPKVQTDKLTSEENEIVKNKLATMYDVKETYGDYSIIEKDNLQGIINNKGKMLTGYEYHKNICYVDSRTAIVSRGYELNGLVSLATGKEIIKADKYDISKFDDNGDIFLVNYGDRIELWDYKGNKISDTFDGLVTYNEYTNFVKAYNVYNGGRVYTLINRQGKKLGAYKDVFDVLSEYSIVEFLDTTKANIAKFGIVNSDGRLITNAKYSYIKIIEQSKHAIFGSKVAGKMRFGMHSLYDLSCADETEDPVNLSLDFDKIGNFQYGYAKVVHNGRFGIINIGASMVVLPEHDRVEIVDRCTARVYDNNTSSIVSL